MATEQQTQLQRVAQELSLLPSGYSRETWEAVLGEVIRYSPCVGQIIIDIDNLCELSDG